MSDSLVLVDLAGNAKAFLEPDDLAVTRRWCGGSSVTATLDVQDPKAAELSVANRALQFFLDGGLRFHGKVSEPLISDQANVSITAGDPWDELTARKLAADETYTAQDAGGIAWASVNTENARATTRLREGTVEATVARTITFMAGTSRADVVTQLSQLDGGFGFALDPVAGVPGTLAELTILADFSRGELPGVRFEYGDGTLANCDGFTEELRRPRNRIVVQGQSLADGTRPEAVAEDIASQDEYGLWESTISLDTTDTAVLAAHARAELRPDPIALYTLKPGPEAPFLFRDFDAGNVVGLAIRHGRVDVSGTARVDECTIRRNTSSDWIIDTLTLSAPAVQRVTRRPDERLYALIGAYRDRIAVLERARVVGS
jgi:hypothetical protein